MHAKSAGKLVGVTECTLNIRHKIMSKVNKEQNLLSCYCLYSVVSSNLHLKLGGCIQEVLTAMLSVGKYCYFG